MSFLPESFLSPLHLPFNQEALRGRFRMASVDADPGAGSSGYWILLRGAEMLVTEGPVPALADALPEALTAAGKPLHIGTWDGRPCRVLGLSWEQELPPSLRAQSLMAPEPQLPIELLSLGALAAQILHWEKGSRYCPACGDSTGPLPGEWGKKCGACGRLNFPAIHPCVIVLVRRGRELLLTRKAEWPVGRYGLVAGFLDFGECLEEAVAREVREETGVEVRNIRYVGSQSWPFPSQLMAGFTAEYAGGEVRVEEKELEDARWFAIDALPTLPPKRSIARYLIDRHGGP